MYTSSYNDEPETIQKMNEFTKKNGYSIDLTDKLKAVIRQPIKK